MTEFEIYHKIQELYNHDLSLQPVDQRSSDPFGHQYEHYHFVHRGSDSILVCIGDSYTKGSGLEGFPPNQDHRLQHMFGNILSQYLHSDFINAGGGGYGNSWYFVNLENLVDWLNASDWKTGWAVLTFTENGRDVKTYSHRKFDYRGHYGGKPTNAALYEKVLYDIETEWIDRLIKCRDRLDPRFSLVCGHNFVCNQRLCQESQRPGIEWISSTWLEHLAQKINKKPPPRTRMTVFHHIETINQILSVEDLSGWKSWFLSQVDDANEVMRWMADTPEFFEPHDLGHPNAAGHKVWADAIFHKLTSSIRVANPIERAAAAHS